MSINVSKIVFKQKGGLEAGPTSTWGWCFAFTQKEDYHPESRELIQAIEQYGKVRVGNRVYTPGRQGWEHIELQEGMMMNIQSV